MNKEELNALKTEVEALNKKLANLSDDEIAQIAGGNFDQIRRSLEPSRDCTYNDPKCSKEPDHRKIVVP